MGDFLRFGRKQDVQSLHWCQKGAQRYLKGTSVVIREPRYNAHLLLIPHAQKNTDFVSDDVFCRSRSSKRVQVAPPQRPATAMMYQWRRWFVDTSTMPSSATGSKWNLPSQLHRSWRQTAVKATKSNQATNPWRQIIHQRKKTQVTK